MEEPTAQGVRNTLFKVVVVVGDGGFGNNSAMTLGFLRNNSVPNRK